MKTYGRMDVWLHEWFQARSRRGTLSGSRTPAVLPVACHCIGWVSQLTVCSKTWNATRSLGYVFFISLGWDVIAWINKDMQIALKRACAVWTLGFVIQGTRKLYLYSLTDCLHRLCTVSFVLTPTIWPAWSGWESVDWTHLAQDRYQWRGFFEHGNEPSGSIKVGDLLR
jgi:hypothetical protein